MPAQLFAGQLTAHKWRLGTRVDALNRLIRDGPNPSTVPSPVECSLAVQDFLDIPGKSIDPPGNKEFGQEPVLDGGRMLGSVSRISVVGASRLSKSG